MRCLAESAAVSPPRSPGFVPTPRSALATPATTAAGPIHKPTPSTLWSVHRPPPAHLPLIPRCTAASRFSRASSVVDARISSHLAIRAIELGLGEAFGSSNTVITTTTTTSASGSASTSVVSATKSKHARDRFHRRRSGCPFSLDHRAQDGAWMPGCAGQNPTRYDSTRERILTARCTGISCRIRIEIFPP